MTTEGRKKGKIVITIHRIALSGHHPECHLSLGSSTLEVPTVDRYIMKKNICSKVEEFYIRSSNKNMHPQFRQLDSNLLLTA